MTDTPKACFFTGHRAIIASDRKPLEHWLREAILDKINHKFTVFITGGAIGFDALAAEQVITLREDYDFIKLHLFLPCTNQDAGWSEAERDKLAKLKVFADKVFYVSEKPYFRGCMKLRNHAMVEAADAGIAYLRRSSGGSYQTVHMAHDAGIPVLNLAKFI